MLKKHKIMKTQEYKGSWTDRFLFRIPGVNHLFGTITHDKSMSGARAVIVKKGVRVFKASKFQALDGNGYLQQLENDLQDNLIKAHNE